MGEIYLNISRKAGLKNKLAELRETISENLVINPHYFLNEFPRTATEISLQQHNRRADYLDALIYAPLALAKQRMNTQYKEKEKEKMLNEITEAAEKLVLKQRPEKVMKVQYGQYSSREIELLYNDSQKSYQQLNSKPDNKIVGSMKAFADCIKEELRRRENETGDKATVRIFSEGGYFIPDEDFGIFMTSYERINSQQWNYIKSHINKIMNHRAFLEFVQALKPSIDGFDNLFQRLSSIRLIGNSTLCSNPIFTNGEQEQGYKCSYKLEDGYEGEEILPQGFICHVPFVKAGEKLYEIPIELLFYRDDNDELGIRVMCPLFENIEEQAIIDEAEFIKEQTAEYKQLLVLSDF